MKPYRFAAFALIITLASCNPTLPPPPPGWNLELRAGTTNIDSSFFQSTKPDTTRSSVDQTRFAQLREAIIKKVPNLNLGSALASGFVPNPKAAKSSTRETAAFSLSLFMAVSKDGAPPASDLSFIYSGPKGTNDKPVVYPAGKAWIASVFTAPKGNGDYTFSSTLQDGTLAGTVSANLEDQTQWLPFAVAVSNPNVFGASMGQYANVFIAKWQAVPEAQSYIGLVLDRTADKYVGSFLTKDTQVETQEFNGVQDHTYSLDLIATNIDLTKDDTKSYGTLPTSMKTSLSRFYLNSFGGTPGLTLDQTRVNLLVKPNQTGEAILKIKNLGTSPLGYTATISGTGLELGAGASSILLNEESRELHVKGTCMGADLTGTITITSNDPNNKTKTVPVTLECDVPVSAMLELKKLTHSQDIRYMQYSPDGTKLATSEGREIIIWDALTSKAIRKITPVTSSPFYSDSVLSIAWHPNSNFLAFGGTNVVTVIDTDTGLNLFTASPNGNIQSIDWNKDGSQFVIGLNAAAQIYNGATGGLIRRIEIPKGDTGIPVKVAWSKSSGKLATVNADQITVWDALTGTELNHYIGSVSPYSGINSIVWNSTGETLALRISEGLIGIWTVSNANLDRTISIELSNLSPENITNTGDMKWSPTSSKIAVMVRKSPIGADPIMLARIWDASTGNFQTDIQVSNINRQPAPLLEWSIDGQFILTQSNLYATSWNIANGVQQMQFGFVQGLISSIHFNTDGSQLLAASNANNINGNYVGSLNLMNIPSGAVLQSFTLSKEITMVDWRKDSAQILAVLSNSGIVQSYIPGSWNLLNTYEGYNPSVYSPDGTKIAVSMNDLKVKILNVSTGEVLQTLTTCVGCNIYSKQSLTWSPDSTKIAVAGESSGSLLSIYNVQDGKSIWEKNAGVSPIFGDFLLWSPDGKRISAGSFFFDAVTGNSVEVFTPTPDGQIPTPLAWSPDSRYLLTKKAGSIELRNSNSGRVVLSILELASQGYGMMSPKVKVDWNAQSNRFAFTDGQSSVYVYKFSQP
jgi:WD40 repeat protein